jgi:hypothetical protein
MTIVIIPPPDPDPEPEEEEESDQSSRRAPERFIPKDKESHDRSIIVLRAGVNFWYAWSSEDEEEEGRAVRIAVENLSSEEWRGDDCMGIRMEGKRARRVDSCLSKRQIIFFLKELGREKKKKRT